MLISILGPYAPPAHIGRENSAKFSNTRLLFFGGSYFELGCGGSYGELSPLQGAGDSWTRLFDNSGHIRMGFADMVSHFFALVSGVLSRGIANICIRLPRMWHYISRRIMNSTHLGLDVPSQGLDRMLSLGQ
jgi:hypothetical protein